MIELYLRCTSEKVFDAFAGAHEWPAPNVAIDKIGSIDDDASFHVNILLNGVEEPAEYPAGIERVTPETPYRVWQ